MGQRRSISLYDSQIEDENQKERYKRDVIKMINVYFETSDSDHREPAPSENGSGHYSWNKFLHPGISVINQIYEKEDETFFLQEAAISRVSTPMPELFDYLMEHQASFPFPYRYAIRDGLLVIQLHVYLAGITKEHLELRLGCFDNFVRKELDFLMETFSIKPLIRPNHNLLLK